MNLEHSDADDPQVTESEDVCAKSKVSICQLDWSSYDPAVVAEFAPDIVVSCDVVSFLRVDCC